MPTVQGKVVIVSFCVQGFVNTRVVVPVDMDVEELQRKLNKGEIVTTIQEGGEVYDMTDAVNVDVMKQIGKVEDVDNNLEYNDFTCEESDEVQVELVLP